MIYIGIRALTFMFRVAGPVIIFILNYYSVHHAFFFPLHLFLTLLFSANDKITHGAQMQLSWERSTWPVSAMPPMQ